MHGIPELPALRQAAARVPGLRLLVLHGSRARGDAHARSDWDFAYTGDEDLDELDLRAVLADVLDNDDIDVANLARAGGLLRYRVAKDGVLEATLGERLSRAAGFRNLVAHAYEGFDMKRVHATATPGPADLLAFLRLARDLVVR